MEINSKKKNIFSRIACLISTHPWLKLIALFLAVIIWFYAKG